MSEEILSRSVLLNFGVVVEIKNVTSTYTILVCVIGIYFSRVLIISYGNNS
jgi:hypothetical protein